MTGSRTFDPRTITLAVGPRNPARFIIVVAREAPAPLPGNRFPAQIRIPRRRSVSFSAKLSAGATLGASARSVRRWAISGSLGAKAKYNDRQTARVARKVPNVTSQTNLRLLPLNFDIYDSPQK